MNKRNQIRCVLTDWSGSEENVAEGRILSSDPNDLVNGIALGPNAVKVLIEKAIQPDAFLWGPATTMFSVEEAVGDMTAWPDNCCVRLDFGFGAHDIAFTVIISYSAP